jgi:uncharacterized protein (TIGR04255 family)
LDSIWEKTVPHYRKAPIIEAAIEFVTRSPADLSAEVVASVYKKDRDDFAERAELRKATVLFQSDQEELSATQEQAGWAWRNSDKTRVVQSRMDGYSFTRGRPYGHWDDFQLDARRLWMLYKSATKPEAVNQISLKYVNRFDIPLPVIELKDYFLTSPEISTKMPQRMAGMFMQLQIPYPEIDSMLALTQTLVPPPQAGYVSVVLVIELTRAVSVPQDDDGIWGVLGQFRGIKNTVFDACLTEKTKELIS